MSGSALPAPHDQQDTCPCGDGGCGHWVIFNGPLEPLTAFACCWQLSNPDQQPSMQEIRAAGFGEAVQVRRAPVVKQVVASVEVEDMLPAFRAKVAQCVGKVAA